MRLGTLDELSSPWQNSKFSSAEVAPSGFGTTAGSA
jgi:hypothetical protein